MKKINTIKQLNAEKKQLAQRREELEKVIRFDWLELKKSVRPGGLFFKRSTGKDGTNGNTIIGDAVAQFADKLTGKLVEKTETKVHKWFRK